MKKTPSGRRLTIDVAAGELPLKQVVLFGTRARTVDITVKLNDAEANALRSYVHRDWTKA